MTGSTTRLSLEMLLFPGNYTGSSICLSSSSSRHDECVDWRIVPSVNARTITLGSEVRGNVNPRFASCF